MINILIISIFGGIISRFHGGGFFHAPKAMRNLAWSMPIAIMCSMVNLWFFIPAFAICLLGKSLGHGRGFNLKEPFEVGAEPEKIEAIIPSFLPVYWQKVLILALTGLAAVSGASLCFLAVDHITAALIALGGLFKGVNGMFFDKNTETREFMDGVVAYGCISYGVYSMVVV